MEIRSFTEADRAPVVQLWTDQNLVVSYNPPDNDIDKCLAGDHATILVGEEDGEVVAAVMTGDDGHRGWIYYLAVASKYQGRHYGEQMVRAAEEWLVANNVRKVMLMVRPTNTRVAGFYEHIGYEFEERMIFSRWLVDKDADS